MLKNCCLVIAVCLGFNMLNAQIDYNKITPISPTAASLGRYGDVPVSFYTGTPNISIPLGVLKGSELELPISLSYMARGVKVEDNGSWVGVNWSLNAGGVITRTVRGLKDGEYPLVAFPLPTDLTDLKDVMTSIQERQVDPEPDLYFFNFNGHSGSFVFDPNGIATFENCNDIKVLTDATHTQFTFLTEDGTQYIFNDTWETTDGLATGINLSQIISATGKEIINFQYVSERFSYYSTKRYTKWIRPNGPSSYLVKEYSTNGSIYPFNTIDARRLTGITTNFNQNIEFIPEGIKRADFADLPSDPGPRMLNRIRFYNGSGNNIKNINFNYEVIDSSLPYIQQDMVVDPPASSVTYLNKRIYLKTIQESSSDLSNSNPPYEFQYFGRTLDNKDLLPNRLSSAQDNWGYYNGANTNLNLWPGYHGPFGSYDRDMSLPVLFFIETVSLPSFNVNGADRRPKFPECSFGTLSSIKYPTGGKTEFEFETLRYVFDASAGKYTTVPKLEIASATAYSSSQTLEDTDELETSLLATFEFELSVTCWDPNTHEELDCTNAAAEPVFDKYQGSSVSVLNSDGVEIFAIKWLPGDHGFWAYRNGFTDSSIGILKPDASGFISRSFELTLEADTFLLKAVRDPDSDTDVHGWLYYTKQVPVDINDPSQAKEIGGLRIKRIENFDLNNSSLGKKTYQYGVGVTRAEPKNVYVYYPFSTPRIIPYWPNSTLDYEGAGGDYYPFLEVGCGSIVEFGYTQGATVGYASVTETQAGNGSTVYKYTTAIDYEDNPETIVSYLFYEDNRWDPNLNAYVNYTDNKDYGFLSKVAWPFIRRDNFEWRRGILKEVDILDNSGNTLLERKMNPVLVDKKTVGGLRLQTIQSDKFWQYGTYFYSTGTMNVETSLETQYNGSQHLDKLTNNFYESTHHNFITKSIVTASSETITTEYHYPDDYENITDPSHVVSKLKAANLHITGVPLETRMYRNGTLIGGAVNQYSMFNKTGGGSFPAISDSYTLRQIQSMPNIGWSPDPTIPDLNYFVKDITMSYDGIGNPIKYQTRDQIETSFVWEGSNPSPIAKVSNASNDEIFHTSFELNGVIQDANNPAKTGNRYSSLGSYDFSVDGNFTPSNPSQLKMSYWYWASGKWNFSGVLSFQNNIVSAGLRLDEIRVFPADAQMTTFTFDQFVGITSSTDPNNSSVYYEYDSFNRLKLIKDDKGNILKSYEYHYRGQN